MTFGSAADGGTIVLSGTSLINGAGGFSVGGGTVLLGNAGVAASYFSGLAPASSVVFVLTGGVLDTGGFAATIDNLAISGGTLQASGGPLDVTSDHGIVSSDMQGSVVGTAQADRLVFNIAGSVDLGLLTFNSWTDGADTITINGSDGANNLIGSTRNDTINGGGGIDSLQGKGGIDTLRGGTGDDTYVIADTQSILIENAGEGTDTIFVLNGGPTAFTLAANFENLTFLGAAQHTGIGNIAGNVLTGGTGIDGLQGREGNDTLRGNEGADTLDGGTGADGMTGGAGDDFYFVDNGGDAVTELAGEGNDRVFALVSYALAAGQEIETLSTEDAAGTAARNLTGNEFANFIMGNAGVNILAGGGGNDTIVGNAGNDQISGGTGADQMNGGLGDDFFFVDAAGDQAFDAAGQGNDRVFASVSFALAAGQEIETLSTDAFDGIGAINLTGNEIANFIMGNAAGNVLNGKDGADTIVGNAGNDQLIGGTGADSMNGGLGDDLFFVDNSGDHAFETAGEGNDRVFATASFALAAGQEIETLSTDNAAGAAAINLTGNELVNFIMGNAASNVLNGGGGNDTIVGNGGNDLLIGGTGADSMNGGLGNDSFFADNGGDQAFEKAGEGSDRVFAGISFTLGAGQEIETLSTDNDSGIGAINLIGNELANTLVGNDGANVLDGKGGNDVLTGNGGADIFAFTSAPGAGNLDQINNFVSGTDKIQLENAVFTGLAGGALNPNAFFAGTAAHDADDRIVYNSATGQLFFDADGNGAGAAVQFATLSGAPIISANDFAVT